RGDVDARLLAWLQAHLPVQVLLALVFALLAGLLAIWLANIYRGWRADADDEERSSLWSWRLFWQQLRQALLGLGQSLRPAGSGRRATTHRAEPQPGSIRQLYA